MNNSICSLLMNMEEEKRPLQMLRHTHTCTSFIALAIKGVLVTTRCHSAQMSILGDAKARKLDSSGKLFSFSLGDREKTLHTVSLISPFSSVKVFNLPFT